MDRFDIPVCLIIFKRAATTVKIIRQLVKIQPSKLYLLADHGRTDEEKKLVKDCRKAVEAAITWPCEVIKYYAEENRGVYDNIAGGAKFVFSREKWAIFLEDDNYPAISFFRYCKELLLKYEKNDEILWICGTNYLGKFQAPNNASYVFTRHLLPCGWASWAEKFNEFYDGDLKGLSEVNAEKKLGEKYFSQKLYKQQLYCFRKEQNRKLAGKKYNSWDYQMAFSVRYYNKLGISPIYNQIENIGVDELSEHGGSSWKKAMTSRFCGVPTHELQFPLLHPGRVSVTLSYEKAVNKIVVNDLRTRLKHKLKCIFLKLLGLDDTLTYKEAKQEIRKKFKF